MRKVPVGDAVGMTICHDMTRIIPGKKKNREFRRGDIITPGDVNRLRLLGKESVYVWEPDPEHVHEDEAALRLARHAAGPGLAWNEPNQGKVILIAQYNGIFKVQVDRLNMINCIENLAIATLHNNQVVKKGEVVAGAKAIPLTVHRSKLDEAEKICCQPPEHLLSVKPFQSLWTGVVITGTEVYSGRIRDGFGNLLRRKTAPFGARMIGQVIVPDSVNVIAEEIRYLVNEGAELILVTGGMSVDPDDNPNGYKSLRGRSGFMEPLYFRDRCSCWPTRAMSRFVVYQREPYLTRLPSWTFFFPGFLPGNV